MGLAPYGEDNPEIEGVLRELIDTGADYDVTELTKRWGTGHGVEILEDAFDRSRTETPGEFDQWERDLAHRPETARKPWWVSRKRPSNSWTRRMSRSPAASR